MPTLKVWRGRRTARKFWSAQTKINSITAEQMEFVEIAVADKKLRILPSRDFYLIGNFCWFKDGSGLFIQRTGRIKFAGANLALQ